MEVSRGCVVTVLVLLVGACALYLLSTLGYLDAAESSARRALSQASETLAQPRHPENGDILDIETPPPSGAGSVQTPTGKKPPRRAADQSAPPDPAVTGKAAEALAELDAAHPKEAERLAAEALELADTPVERMLAGEALAEALAAQGDTEAALAALEPALAETAPASEATMRAWVLMGRLRMERGEGAAGAQAYREALTVYFATPHIEGPSAERLAREAALPLIRWYRETGQEAEARKIRRSVSGVLSAG